MSCFVSCWNPLHARLFFFSISEWNLRRTNTKMIIFKTTSNVIWDWERKNVVESRKTDQPKGIEMNCSDIPPLFNKSIKRLSKGFRFFDAFFSVQHHSIIFLSPVSSYTHKILIIFQVKERGALLWGCQCICLDFFPSVFFSFFGLSSILMCRLFTAAIFNNNSRTVF